MARYILHKEMIAFQWDGDNYESILNKFGSEWILGVTSYSANHGFDYTGYNKGKNYLRVKLPDDENRVRLIPLGSYVCQYKGSPEVFEMKQREFKNMGFVKDYEYEEN